MRQSLLPFAVAFVVVMGLEILQGQSRVSPHPESSYFQSLSDSERKDYEALRLDWEKQKNGGPQSWEKLHKRVTLHSQFILGRFGYGTLFTGNLDDRTREALRAYQSKLGLPETSDVDAITYYALTKDSDAADKIVTFLPAFDLFFHEDYVSADGVWDRMNESESSIQTAHLECFADRRACIEADATLLQILGSPGLTSTMREYHVTKWDSFEVIAEDSTPDCERDQLLINQQEKSVAII